MHPHDFHQVVLKGIVGTVAPILGALTSMQEQLEHWLRVGSLFVGLIVGLLTAWSLLRGAGRK